MRGRNGTVHRYYDCNNHDPLRVGGEDRARPERNIRADELDAFVFERIRDTLLRPDVLLAGEHTVGGCAKRWTIANAILSPPGDWGGPMAVRVSTSAFRPGMRRATW